MNFFSFLEQGRKFWKNLDNLPVIYKKNVRGKEVVDCKKNNGYKRLKKYTSF